MIGFNYIHAVSLMVQVVAATSFGVFALPATAEPRPEPIMLSAQIIAAPVSFVEGQLATSRQFVAQAIQESQQTLATLLAANDFSSLPWTSIASQPGTVQDRLTDYAETQRTAFEEYGDLLRLRHQRILLELDERQAGLVLDFMTTGFLVSPPNMMPIAQLPPPVLSFPNPATAFPGLSYHTAGFFSSRTTNP
jgi:hypothetical protein